MSHLKTGTASTKTSVRTKLQNIAENVMGSVRFLKAYGDFTMHNDDWEEQLTLLLPKFQEFFTSRNADINSFPDVINWGPMFIVTQDHFLRGEYIKENIELTEAEKKEMQAEIDDSFYNEATRKTMLAYSAFVGWRISVLLTPLLDEKLLEEMLERKMRSIRINMYAQQAATNLAKSMELINTGLLLSAKLEDDCGVTVMADNTLEGRDEEAEKLIKEIESPDFKLGNINAALSSDESEAKRINKEFESAESAFTKLVLQCTALNKL